MSQIVHTVRTVRGANLHTIFEKQQNKEETLLNKILQELIQRGGEFAENASVILELLTLKISGKPMDDRSLVVRLVPHPQETNPSWLT
jgi:tRNA uridine 5-carbamoylmethylation protein Kti12